MKAIEFQTKLHSSKAIKVPEDEELWKKLATTQFFAGYSDEDAIYDKMQ